MTGTRIKSRIGALVRPAAGYARIIETFDRPPWLLRVRGAARTGVEAYRAPRPVTEADVELCQRLVDAYRLAASDAPPASGIWSHDVFQERQRQLRDALTLGDPVSLADLLASMFRSDFVIGMARGSLDLRRRRGAVAHLSRLTIVTKLVALAEAIGTTRLENPEQGPVGAALGSDLDELVAGVERQLGVSLDFPHVGAAHGLAVGARLIPFDSPDQVYGALRLRDVMRAYLQPSSEPPRVVEIGGGYGGMAYWFARMVDARYVIVDLPIVGVIQGYFLSQALGNDAVALYGEPAAQVTIVPGHALSSVQTPFDVLVNKDSLPEIPLDAALGYLEWARSACRGIFYSYNHESTAPFGGTTQNVVRELVQRVGGFTGVRRDASWVRRGYVEEVFVRARSEDTGVETRRS